MRLPDFLIIGAMKSGTTTLFEDLSTSPAVYFPVDKEPGNLTDDRVLTSEGLRDYAALFERAHGSQVCGEASTTYTKLPDVEGCAERAAALFQKPPRIIYLVREPVSRAISQYKHEVGLKTLAGPIDSAIFRFPRLVDYSRYTMQLTPWMEAFGAESVKVVRFEDYTADRWGIARDIAEFIGVDPSTMTIDPSQRFNDSNNKVVATGVAAKFVHSSFYRSAIRPYFARRIRQKIARILLPRAPIEFEPPSLETVDYMLDRLREDISRLQAMVRADSPLWDLDAVRAEYAAGAANRGAESGA